MTPAERKRVAMGLVNRMRLAALGEVDPVIAVIDAAAMLTVYACEFAFTVYKRETGDYGLTRAAAWRGVRERIQRSMDELAPIALDGEDSAEVL